MGRTGDEEVRRIMVEVGEETWGRAWPALYDSLGGNPWAAMPSLHFATSLMAALLLAEAGPVEGAVGWAYAATLGFHGATVREIPDRTNWTAQRAAALAAQLSRRSERAWYDSGGAGPRRALTFEGRATEVKV